MIGCSTIISLTMPIPANMVTGDNEYADDDDVDDVDDDDDGYGDEVVGADSDDNSGADAAGISINAEYGNIISIMHYNYDTTMQATLS